MSAHTNQTTANAEKRPGPNNARNVEQAFVSEIQRRFRRLRGLIRTTVGYDNDALNLSANAEPRERFDFNSRQELTFKFVQWLRDAINDEILEPVSPVEAQEGQHWTSPYLRRALVQGQNQATGLLLQQGVSIDNVPDDEIPTRPINAKTLRDLYQRTYSELSSLTDDMVPEVREKLTTGFAKGHGPRKIADSLTKEIRDLQHTRAETIARSEVMNAHSESALSTYEQAGVSVVGHTTWNSANDTRTCPFCRRLDGVALTLEEARSATVQWGGQIYRLQSPAHPNGRCIHTPSVGSDPPTTTLQERLNEEFGSITVLSGA